MTANSLESLLQSTGNIVDFLRNQQTGPNVYPGVPAEYTNWRDEQWAWQQTARAVQPVLPHGGPRGRRPGRLRAAQPSRHQQLQGLRAVDKAKQFVPVTPEGYVIGDVILFYLAENKFNLVGRAPAIEWVEFHAATGKWDVKVERDERTALRTDGQAQDPIASRSRARTR